MAKMSKEEKLKLEEVAEQFLNTAVPTVTEDKSLDEAEKTGPEPGDPEWTDYVLDQLSEGEKVVMDRGICPKTDGLRRVATKQYGPLSEETEVLNWPQDGKHSAVVKVTISYKEKYSDSHRYVSGAANVNSKTTNEPYVYHAVACAETKAEGRALRRLLCLAGVIVAEELGDVDFVPTAPVETGFSNALRKQMKNNNIDEAALLKEMQLQDTKGNIATTLDTLTQAGFKQVSSKIMNIIEKG
jgi:hypothetical protein